MRGSPRTKIRAERTSNVYRELRSAGFTPQKIRYELLSNRSRKSPRKNCSQDSGGTAQDFIKDSSSSLRSLFLRMRGARKTSPFGMATPGAPFPLACRHLVGRLRRASFLHAFLLSSYYFGIGRIVGRLFFVTSLFSYCLVLGVLTGAPPFCLHINFGTVLICSFGSSFVSWVWMFPVEHQVRSSCLQAQVPTLGHWNPEVGKPWTLEPQNCVSGPADNVFG